MMVMMMMVMMVMMVMVVDNFLFDFCYAKISKIITVAVVYKMSD